VLIGWARAFLGVARALSQMMLDLAMNFGTCTVLTSHTIWLTGYDERLAWERMHVCWMALAQ